MDRIHLGLATFVAIRRNPEDIEKMDGRFVGLELVVLPMGQTNQNIPTKILVWGNDKPGNMVGPAIAFRL